MILQEIRTAVERVIRPVEGEEVLEEYKNNGLWIVKQNSKDNTFTIEKQKLTEEQYKTALDELNKLNNNGFTQEEQKKIDEIKTKTGPGLAGGPKM